MYVLKDRKCERCGGDIIVLPFKGENNFGKSEIVVDYGVCEYCEKVDILPTEDYRSFVSEFCIRK